MNKINAKCPVCDCWSYIGDWIGDVCCRKCKVERDKKILEDKQNE